MELFLDKFEGFVGVNFWTMLFAWVNILILYLAMRKYLFVPIKNMIDSRQKEIDDLYADAEQSRESAQAMAQEYQEKLAHAEEEGEEIRRNAQRRATLREEEILREAEETARRTLRRAEEQVELEKARALNEVKDEVGTLAVEIATAIIGRDVQGDEHAALIDAFIENVGEDK